jgi:hypothetical protein
MENTLLDELASTIETVHRTDLEIRQSVESCQWDTGHRLSAGLADWLAQKRLTGEAIRRQLIDLSDTYAGYAAQIGRCSDMTSHLLGAISKYLPIYQRIAAGLAEKRGNEGSKGVS